MAALPPGSKPSPSPVANKPFVLVPLYIYPFPTAWDPLFVAVDSHPELDFLVVVNPGSGPGPGILPDANYIEVLARLTAAPNVKVIGYVHCSYGNRLLDDLVAETIVVDGIFFDEVPSSTEFVQYMASLSTATKTILNRNPLPGHAGDDEDQSAEANDVSAGELDLASPTSTASPVSPRAPAPASPSASWPPAGLTSPLLPPNSTAVVIYNPGVVVDPIFYQAADYIVAFENASRQWNAPAVTQGFSRLPRPLRKKSIAVAHSAAGGFVEIGQLSRKCYELGCSGQFITTRPGYEEWCPSWPEFVQEMARRTAI
ncbi:hypothetical protein diail_7350 [Diaporthe ilicicola]|nr:hypothetical protein diail_7350 [Diaporthe ilicicola]